MWRAGFARPPQQQLSLSLDAESVPRLMFAQGVGVAAVTPPNQVNTRALLIAPAGS
jgi:hypothetical protein